MKPQAYICTAAVDMTAITTKTGCMSRNTWTTIYVTKSLIAEPEHFCVPTTITSTLGNALLSTPSPPLGLDILFIFLLILPSKHRLYTDFTLARSETGENSE